MTEQELEKLNGIIAALKDIHASVKSGTRNRHFAAIDLYEETNNLKELTLVVNERLYGKTC